MKLTPELNSQNDRSDNNLFSQTKFKMFTIKDNTKKCPSLVKREKTLNTKNIRIQQM